jgi:hypothetical protein
VPARFVVVALVLTACAKTAPSANTLDTIDGSQSVENSYPPVATSATLNCGDEIFSLDAPQDGEEMVGDGIALQTSRSTAQAFQTNRTRDSNPALRLFAKTGLSVRSGVASELIVPDRWVGHLAFIWGGTPPATRLVIGPCSSGSVWTVFAGGYLASEVGCFDFIVRTNNVDRTVSVGVGSPCPGQTAPNGPSES